MIGSRLVRDNRARTADQRVAGGGDGDTGHDSRLGVFDGAGHRAGQLLSDCRGRQQAQADQTRQNANLHEVSPASQFVNALVRDGRNEARLISAPFT